MLIPFISTPNTPFASPPDSPCPSRPSEWRCHSYSCNQKWAFWTNFWKTWRPFQYPTADGKNPAPVDMGNIINITLFTGFVYIPGGCLGCLPSTVCCSSFKRNLKFPNNFTKSSTPKKHQHILPKTPSISLYHLGSNCSKGVSSGTWTSSRCRFMGSWDSIRST